MTLPQAGPASWGAPPLVYASWPRRVAGFLVDTLLTTLAAVPGYLVFLGGTTTTTTTHDDIGQTFTSSEWDRQRWIGVLLIYGLSLAVWFWNTVVRQGRTGRTVGKQVVRIRLIRRIGHEPVGGWLSFGRQLAHVLDSAVCYLGWLWPLWDTKCQTFADKIADTVVVVPTRVAQR